MVYKCFVYGCKTHKQPKNTTFGVPKDADSLRQWQVALRPYSNGKELLAKHRVCKAHFRPEELDFYYTHLIQGAEVKIERGRPELKKGAVPSIFPGQKKPPRRILQYKKEDKYERREQSILTLTGEWVHVKNPNIPRPERKRVYKRRANKSPASIGEDENSSPQAKKQKPAESINGLTEEIRSDELIHSLDYCALSIPEPEPPAVKPHDKEISSICINWDALPLPEEIGSLLCDNLAPPVHPSSDFHIQPSKSLSPASSTPVPAPVDLPSEDISREQLPKEELPEEHHLATDIIKQPSENEEITVLSFQGLLLNMSQIQVPSAMWGVHTDHTRVYFSCMSYSGCIAIPKVEKIVMYQGNMFPRIFLRGIEVGISVFDKKSTSLQDIEDVLFQVDSLKLCLGIDSAGDVVSYSSECEIFVESGRLPRCPTCRQERLVENTKRRHLETDSVSSPRTPKKKQSAAK